MVDEGKQRQGPLSHFGGEEVLQRLLDAEVPLDLREEAIAEVGSRRLAKGAELLLGIAGGVSGEELYLRAAAIGALAKYEDEATRRRMLALAMSRSDLVEPIAYLLGESGYWPAVPVLVGLCNSSVSAHRRAAAAALLWERFGLVEGVDRFLSSKDLGAEDFIALLQAWQRVPPAKRDDSAFVARLRRVYRRAVALEGSEVEMYLPRPIIAHLPGIPIRWRGKVQRVPGPEAVLFCIGTLLNWTPAGGNLARFVRRSGKKKELRRRVEARLGL